MAWCVLALAIATIAEGPVAKLPHITPDSTQYLNAAQHLRLDHRMETSLVHFDTERSHGAIPAPLTWFPPGYPAAIAAVSPIAGNYETAALCVSLASFTLVAAGLWFLMRILDPSLWVARAAVLCWIANSQALFVSSAALSESLFTLLGIAMLLLLIRAGWTGAAGMAGLSYWVRYAGLLWIGAFLAVLAVEMIFRKKNSPSWRTAIVSGASLILLTAPLMIRNLLLVGDWRGGNNTHFAAPIREFAVSTPKLWYHLVIGEAAMRQLWIPVVLLSIGLIGICAIGIVKAAVKPSLPPEAAFRILLVVVLVYAGGIAAIALRSVISYAPRMYVPVLPHLIALGVLGVTFLIRRLPATGWPRQVSVSLAVCVVLGYAAANFISCVARPVDDVQRTRDALAGIENLLPGNETIAATNGQIAGYILKRPTLSLVGRPYSMLTWDEATVRAEMARYGATSLLVFRDPVLDPVVQDSAFLTALADGHATPWLQPVAANQDVRVYRLAP